MLAVFLMYRRIVLFLFLRISCPLIFFPLFKFNNGQKIKKLVASIFYSNNLNLIGKLK